MKKIKFICFIAIAFIMASCGSMRKNEFAKQKYTNFSRSHASVKKSNSVTASVKSIQANVNELAVTNAFENSNVNAPECILHESALQNTVIENGQNSVKENNNAISVNNNLRSSLIQKKVVKQLFKKSKNEKKHSRVDDIVLLILAILLPPLAVYLAKGIGTEFWIDILLCLLFWIPGIIYAIIVCL